MTLDADPKTSNYINTLIWSYADAAPTSLDQRGVQFGTGFGMARLGGSLGGQGHNCVYLGLRPLMT